MPDTATRLQSPWWAVETAPHPPFLQALPHQTLSQDLGDEKEVMAQLRQV